MHIKTYLGIMASLVLLSACGGGKHADAVKSEALTACDPASGPSGTVVTCQAPNGVGEDCTFFFGNDPVDISQNDGSFSFTTPAGPSGPMDMHFQCGASDPTPFGSFAMTAAPTEEGSTAGQTGGTTGGEPAIIPSGAGGGGSGGDTGTTGGSGGSTGATTPPADSDQDGIPDSDDKCPNTVEGATVDPTGCEPPPPAPTGVAINSFDLQPVGDVKLSTYKITWNFSNAKVAYLWGTVFNRDASDADLDAAKRCQHASDRFLVTRPDGHDFGANSPSDQDKLDKKTYAPYLEGVPCDNTDGSDKNDCQNLAGASEEHEKNPACRIDLNNGDGSLISSNTDGIFTRSLIMTGKACLYVEGEKGHWLVKCHGATADPVTLNLGANGITVSKDEPKILLNFSYDHAITNPAVPHCKKTGGQDVDSSGRGVYQGECKIDSDNVPFSIALQGIGAGNAVSHSYTLALHKPKIEQWAEFGQAPEKESGGRIKFKYSVSRKYDIQEHDKTIDGGSGACPWVRHVVFNGTYLKDDGKDATGGNLVSSQTLSVERDRDASGYITAYKNPTSTFWSFAAYSFDESEMALSDVVWEKYPSSDLRVTAFKGVGHYSFDYDPCDFDENAADGDCCDTTSTPGIGSCNHDSDDGAWDCRGYNMDASVSWEGHYLKSIQATCYGTGENSTGKKYVVNLNPKDPGVGKQSGHFTLSGVPGEQVVCSFTAKSAFGDEDLVSNDLPPMQKAHRGPGFCDGPDINDGSDNDDAADGF